MNNLALVLLLLVFAGCNDSQRYNVSDYLTPAREQSILDQSVRYMYYTEGIPAASRFDAAYDVKYKAAGRAFYFARYFFITPEGAHTFLIVRKYPGEKYRGIIGTLKVDGNDRILRFEEKLVTPLASKDEVLEKGGFLFRQLVGKGSIDPEYYKMKSYIEWPDEQVMYDTVAHEWRRR